MSNNNSTTVDTSTATITINEVNFNYPIEDKPLVESIVKRPNFKDNPLGLVKALKALTDLKKVCKAVETSTKLTSALAIERLVSNSEFNSLSEVIEFKKELDKTVWIEANIASAKKSIRNRETQNTINTKEKNYLLELVKEYKAKGEDSILELPPKKELKKLVK